MRDLILSALIVWLVAGCNIFSTDSGVEIMISGKVYDMDTDTPIPQAIIELWGVDIWGDSKLIKRTYSSGTIGSSIGAGDYLIQTRTTAYNDCDSTGIRLNAFQKIVYADNSQVSYRLPEGSISINCNANTDHIKRIINMGLEKY